jgi:hypothetical protein
MMLLHAWLRDVFVIYVIIVPTLFLKFAKTLTRAPHTNSQSKGVRS